MPGRRTVAAVAAKTDPWVTPEELAEELRIPVGTIYSWRSRGKGPAASKFGRHLRFKRSAINKWLADCANAGTRATA